MVSVRIVLTGGPSSGKTTVINELEKRGFSVLRESSREILGRFGTINSKEEREELELTIFKTQKKKEEACEETVFLDRSQIDSLAYTNYFLGYIPKEMGLPKKSYDVVFLLDRLPFVKDGLRVENSDSEANKLHLILKQAYLKLGYFPILVPTFPSVFVEASVRRRVNFILSYLRDIGIDIDKEVKSTIF